VSTPLGMIAAMNSKRVIGIDNTLPWHLPADLQYFKATTLGKPVIMGRLTWESLGRPLPGRKNIVISRNADYQAEGAEVVGSLDAAIELAEQTSPSEIMLIGGGQLYREALTIAQTVYLTEVDNDLDGDTTFPMLDSGNWSEASREQHQKDDRNEFNYAFLRYERR
jgi:dihydrofolate reductase